MGKILHNNLIFKMIKMNIQFKFFRSFKICYYWHLKLPDQYYSWISRILIDSSTSAEAYW